MDTDITLILDCAIPVLPNMVFMNNDGSDDITHDLSLTKRSRQYPPNVHHLYLDEIDPRPLKHIMQDIRRGLLVFSHNSRMQSNLGVCPCRFAF